jgi:hypothetical protein
LYLFLRLPQPGEPGSCIYFPQEQGVPVIPPVIGFSIQCEWVSEWVNLRPTVCRPVCPGVRRKSGICDQFIFRHEISF